jgi:uncharacterized protein with PQ loop repeat
MELNLAILAGAISTIVFVGSVLPMLTKAVRTRDLASYSLGNLLLANLGNVVHSIYVYSLPMGPIWALHGFYLLTSGFMLVMYLRHRDPRHREMPGRDIEIVAFENDALRTDAPQNLVRAPGRGTDHELKPVGVL